ncbi:MAG: DUF3168 domain-containing protein [bacterium]
MTLTIGQGIEAALKAHAGTAALVGTRVTAFILGEGMALPAITYQRISASPGPAFGTATSTVSERWQVACWATTASGAQAVADQVLACLDGYAGKLGGTTGIQSTVTYQGANDLEDAVTGWVQVILEFEVWH